MNLLFWRKPKWYTIDTGFSYTVPKGNWNVQQNIRTDAKGNTHTTVILTEHPPKGDTQ